MLVVRLLLQLRDEACHGLLFSYDNITDIQQQVRAQHWHAYFIHGQPQFCAIAPDSLHSSHAQCAVVRVHFINGRRVDQVGVELFYSMLYTSHQELTIFDTAIREAPKHRFTVPENSGCLSAFRAA